MSSVAFAQYSVTSAPSDVINQFLTDYDINNVPTFDIPAFTPKEKEEIALEDSLDGIENKPYRVGKHVPVDITSANSGEWRHNKTSRYWVLKIKAEEARGLRVWFDDLEIPKGAEIYLLSASQDVIMGPLTNENLPHLPQIGTDFIPSDAVFLVYTEPINVKVSHNLTISKISYGYRGVQENNNDLDKDDGDAASCHIGAASYHGDCFRLEMRGVGMLSTSDDNSDAFCSCSLINNTSNDLSGLVLTADHCMDGQNESTVVFRFKNFSGSTSVPVFTGSEILAHSANRADFALLRMLNNQRPSIADGMFYLGWSRGNSLAEGTMLHHPMGAKMKISSSHNIVTFDFCGIGCSIIPGSIWAGNFDGPNDFGLTQPGSSGSAILNNLTHRVQGQLASGNSECDDLGASDFWGKFTTSWLGNSTPQTRLSDWLDNNNNSVVESQLLSTFDLMQNDKIPCTTLLQDANVLLLKTNNNVPYRYTWSSSPNIQVVGSGNNVKFKAIAAKPIGTTEWVQCEIMTPVSCGDNLLIARSRKTLNWVSSNAAAVKLVNATTGNPVSYFSMLGVNNSYTFNVSFEGVPVPIGTTFQWTFTGANNFFYTLNTTGSTITITTTQLGTFTANVKPIPNSCSATGYSFVFNVQSGGNIVGNEGSEGEQQAIPADKNMGVGEPNTTRVLLFPNPAEDILHVSVSNVGTDEAFRICVKDIQGRVLLSQTVTSAFSTLNISSLPEGYYFIEVFSDEWVKNERFVVVRKQ